MLKRMLLTAVIGLLFLFGAGCTSTLRYPLEIRSTYKLGDGSCRIAVWNTDDTMSWSQNSPDLCQYKAGDILK
jgi:hypothetical protein